MTRRRIVLAEDHEDMARQLQMLLAADYDIEVTRDGRSLIEAVDASPPDAIVSDIAMPEIDGLAATRIIIEKHPHACIVVVTVHEDPTTIRAAMTAGALGYVAKADAGDELTLAVRSVLEGDAYMSSSVRKALARHKRRTAR